MDPSASTPLAAFLADRDEPCPGCNYNLRGVTGPACPECGKPIALAIHRPAGRGHAVLLLVLLGWVLAAAGMSATRAALSARDQARPSTLSTLMTRVSSGSLTLGGGATFRSSTLAPIVMSVGPQGAGVSGGVAATAGRVTLSPTTTGSAAQRVTQLTAPQITIQSTPLTTQQTVILGPRNFTFAPAATNWGAVSWQTWTALVYWGGLALVAAVLLAVTLIFRRRLAREGVRRALIPAAAWGAFALYAGGQAFLFIRDMMA